jgi:hypothetical protein
MTSKAAHCLALGGADNIFQPTLGGAAIGDDAIALAAFWTRAAENFVNPSFLLYER